MTSESDTQERHAGLAAGLAPRARRGARPRPGPAPASSGGTAENPAPGPGPETGGQANGQASIRPEGSPRDTGSSGGQSTETSKAGANPDRGSAKTATIAPSADSTESGAAPAAKTVAEKRESVPEDTPGRTRRKYRRRKRKGPAALTFYVPPPVKEELQQRGSLPGKSQVRVLLEALITTEERMPELLQSWHDATKPAKTGRFVFPQAKVADPEGRVMVNLRINPVNRDAIGDLLDEADEENMSLYIKVALKTYFSETDMYGNPVVAP